MTRQPEHHPARRAAAAIRRAVVRPMTSGAKRATITLLLISFAIGGANLLFTAREVNAVRRVQATAAQLCQAGNQARAQQVVLWSHLVVISKPPPHETVQARNQRVRTTRDFLAYVHRVFAPRNCQHPLTSR